MGQVVRGETVHGIVFTSVHGAGGGSPAGDGGAVAEFGPNFATFGEAPCESTLRQSFTDDSCRLFWQSCIV